MKWPRLNRKIHYWAAIICALPVLIVIVSGLFLLLKKDIAWIQPPTRTGTGSGPTLSFHKMMEAAVGVPQAGIQTWEDVERLDVRPDKGVIKLLSRTRWEIQIDQQTGAVLQTAYRRSDLIESLHDGTFFHDKVRLWVFLPSAVLLLVLWVTGIYLFLLPYWTRARRRRGGSGITAA